MRFVFYFLFKAKSEKISSLTRRSLPSFHFGFIALVPTPEKEVVPTRAKPRKTRSFTQSFVEEIFSDFAIYILKNNNKNIFHLITKVRQTACYVINILCRTRHVTLLASVFCACDTMRILVIPYMHARHVMAP